MRLNVASRWAIAAICSAVFLSSCGSKNSLGYVLNGHIAISPNPLNLNGIGTNHAATIVATDNGYSGTISVSTSCPTGPEPIAQISPTSGSAPLTVTATPVKTGSCTVTFSDSNGLTQTGTVNVTTSGIGVSSGSRK